MTPSRALRPASGLLARLRPAAVAVDDVRAAAATVLPALATGSLRAAVLTDPSGGPVLVLAEDERRTRLPLRDLAEDMTDAGVAPTADGVAAALTAVVTGRPVSDAAAARAGVAVLDWADGARSAVGWRVVVRRGERTVAWTPSDRADADVVARTRSGATARAADAGGVLRVEGPVALWSHPGAPVLATAALAAPDRLLARIADAGLPLRDPHVVVTPARPLACAVAGVADRLAALTGEACVRLPWSGLAALRWL
ncbi:hypothetical protein SAMN04488107_2772 [Geodermatophilus saharensis]|uniref:Uncharacterized protein n=1 Tax=Geodermatophilus saharensis TaxID=1137994 RepID=A0A239F037_9ACTN|nr:hypothetical protein [Geodermatophilus saharensis]SNS50249.1 hypothetical protein SAMN04488107_2772 [Geodermatophilus saharensis]